jgi:hypothetical protein
MPEQNPEHAITFTMGREYNCCNGKVIKRTAKYRFEGAFCGTQKAAWACPTAVRIDDTNKPVFGVALLLWITDGLKLTASFLVAPGLPGALPLRHHSRRKARGGGHG